jgi:tetrahydromethanopterin S-methyltransferase subunit H
MFKYDTPQKVYEIGRAKVGGNPGEYPTVLAGSIFFAKEKVFASKEDMDKGIFNKEMAEKLVRTQEEMSDITGNKVWLQIMAETDASMIKEIEWYANIGKDAFLVDSSAASAKIVGSKRADEMGLSDRVIYNSINAACTPAELDAIKPLKFTSAIVLGFNPMDMSVKGRMEMLTKGGAGQTKGMMTIASEKGVTRPLVDVAATSLGAGSGSTYRSIFAVKSQLGEPVGGGYHNIPDAWAWLKKFKKLPGHEKVVEPASIGSNLIAVTLGCNYCLYGPIDAAVEVFPSIAMNDIIVEEAAKEMGTAFAADVLPLTKLV